MKIEIPGKAFDGIEAVRQSGRTNMCDVNMVQRICHEMDFYEAVIWIEDNRDKYAEAIFAGFKVID